MTEPQSQEPAVPEAEPKPEATPEPLFVARTQKDLDKKFSEEKKAAAQARERKLLEDSGAESVEDLIAAYEAQKIMDEEAATETEKERKEREKAEAQRDAVKEELESAYAFIAEMKQEAAVKEALAEAGADPNRLKATMKFIDFDELEVDAEGNVTGAKEAVEAAQKEFPEGFGSDRPSGSRPSPRPADAPTSHQQDKEIAQAERGRVAASL